MRMEVFKETKMESNWWKISTDRGSEFEDRV
jgi:hypothetical protein